MAKINMSEIIKRVTSLEEKLSAGGSEFSKMLTGGQDEPEAPAAFMVPASQNIIAINRTHELAAIEETIRERESAAYNRGMTFGIAVASVLGMTILMKLLR